MVWEGILLSDPGLQPGANYKIRTPGCVHVNRRIKRRHR